MKSVIVQCTMQYVIDPSTTGVIFAVQEDFNTYALLQAEAAFDKVGRRKDWYVGPTIVEEVEDESA